MFIARGSLWGALLAIMAVHAGTVFGQASSPSSGPAASPGSGQAYPNKPVRIVTSGIGGGADSASRLIAPGLGDNLGQRVIVENRGGGPFSAAEQVTKSPPDGYTLILYSSSLWLTPLMQNVTYDMDRDFSPVCMAINQPNILVVHPSLPVRSVKELIALAKARPGQLNYGSAGAGSTISGSSTNLAGELFKAMSGVQMVRINYKGAGAIITALISGEVQMMFATSISAMPHLKSGRLKGLAVASAQPSALLPGLPTVAASGLPGYEAASTSAVFAPAKTPVAIVRRLNQEIVKVLNQSEIKEKFANSGVEVVASTPEQLALGVKSEIARLTRVIRDAGIRD